MKGTNMQWDILRTTLPAALLAASLSTQAHGPEGHEHGKSKAAARVAQKEHGLPGDASKVSKTVTLEMFEQPRFSPDTISARKGETLRIVVKNSGSRPQAFAIGTRKTLDEQVALMKKYPGMQPDRESSVRVEPGAHGEIIWQFTHEGEYAFALLDAGRYEAGARGRIEVR
jgi:uncharacterized cupredoxin-like copper-binding protein